MDKPISMRDKVLQLEAQVEALTKIISGALNKSLEGNLTGESLTTNIDQKIMETESMLTDLKEVRSKLSEEGKITPPKA